LRIDQHNSARLSEGMDSLLVSIPPATEDQILHAEQKIGFSFPGDFVVYLKSINGGQIKDGYVKNFVIKRPSRQDTLFPITHLLGIGEQLSLLEYLHLSKPQPDWLLPIATVHNGPKFMVDLRAETKGQVCLDVRDAPYNPNPIFTPEEFLRPNDDADVVDFYEEFTPYYWPVAKSFSEFLEIAGVELK